VPISSSGAPGTAAAARRAARYRARPSSSGMKPLTVQARANRRSVPVPAFESSGRGAGGADVTSGNGSATTSPFFQVLVLAGDTGAPVQRRRQVLGVVGEEDLVEKMNLPIHSTPNAPMNDPVTTTVWTAWE